MPEVVFGEIVVQHMTTPGSANPARFSQGRITLILGIGFCAALAMLVVPRWIASRNRPISQAEVDAEAARADADQTAWLKIKPRRLGELDEKYQDAVKVVASVLVSCSLEPSEYRAVVEERTEENLYIFHLYHLSAFAAKREGQGSVGNPGGECYDIVYNRKSGRASPPEIWQ